MSIRSCLQHAQRSGWKFVTSAGADLSVGAVSASSGFIDVISDADARGSQQIARLFYATAGGSISLSAPVGGDISTTEMFSAGSIFSLIGRPLTTADLQGGCIVVSLGGAVLLGGSAGLMFFGAPFGLVASSSIVGALQFMPGINMLPVPHLAAYLLQSALWESFKGVAALAGINDGMQLGVGISMLQGIVRML